MCGCFCLHENQLLLLKGVTISVLLVVMCLLSVTRKLTWSKWGSIDRFASICTAYSIKYIHYEIMRHHYLWQPLFRLQTGSGCGLFMGCCCFFKQKWEQNEYNQTNIRWKEVRWNQANVEFLTLNLDNLLFKVGASGNCIERWSKMPNQRSSKKLHET